MGIYFISGMTTTLLNGDLYKNWSRVASRINLETFNSKLVRDPLVDSKSVIAGSYADMVPSDMIDHHNWLLNSRVVADNTNVSIPKIDIAFSKSINLSAEKISNTFR